MDENIVITSVKTGEIYKLKGDVQQAFAFRDRIKALIGESFTDDEAISRIDHLESFHAENLAFRAIIEMRKTLSKPQENTANLVDNSYIAIENLQHELRIANKVIARLLGE